MSGLLAMSDFPDPDADFMELSLEDDDPTKFTKPSTKKGQGIEEDPPYILGTLVVRVVAARDLEPVIKGKGLQRMFGGGGRRSQAGGSANPYGSIKFGSTTQRTSVVRDTLDPLFPRLDAMFMDVALPPSELTHPEADESNFTSDSSQENLSSPVAEYEKPNTVMTVAMFSTQDMVGSSNGKFPTKGSGLLSGDSDDMFLGMASADLTRLLTGTDTTFDEWLTLKGTETSRGSVRVVCEYEPSDALPRPGDFCRFTRYCNPKDLYPLVPGRQYIVAEVEGDVVLVTYTTHEGWVCSFEAHRYMLVCQENQNHFETAQDEIVLMAERLSHSPLVHSVTETVERVAVDGFLNVGQEVVRGGWGLLNRWIEGGVDTAIDDVTNVTNWDGRYNPNNSQRLDLPDAPPDAVSSGSLSNDNDDDEVFDSSEGQGEISKALHGMPCCPITGEPMVDPAVAADGHTYERAAISRWFKTSNKSPLTGAVLIHKELVSNFMLLSSIQETASLTTNAALKPPPSNEPEEETIVFEGEVDADSS